MVARARVNDRTARQRNIAVSASDQVVVQGQAGGDEDEEAPREHVEAAGEHDEQAHGDGGHHGPDRPLPGGEEERAPGHRGGERDPQDGERAEHELPRRTKREARLVAVRRALHEHPTHLRVERRPPPRPRPPTTAISAAGPGSSTRAMTPTTTGAGARRRRTVSATVVGTRQATRPTAHSPHRPMAATRPTGVLVPSSRSPTATPTVSGRSSHSTRSTHTRRSTHRRRLADGGIDPPT